MGTIVVGVDGSAGSLAALRFAVEEAELRGAVVNAVHAWRLPLYEGVPGPFLVEAPAAGPALEEARAILQREAERVLDRAVADATGGESGVEIRREAVEGAPVHALVERAARADLLVVGSRGRGGFAGLLLGSVSQQCAQRAPCPVVIVPAAAGR